MRKNFKEIRECIHEKLEKKIHCLHVKRQIIIWNYTKYTWKNSLLLRNIHWCLFLYMIYECFTCIFQHFLCFYYKKTPKVTKLLIFPRKNGSWNFHIKFIKDYFFLPVICSSRLTKSDLPFSMTFFHGLILKNSLRFTVYSL